MLVYCVATSSFLSSGLEMQTLSAEEAEQKLAKLLSRLLTGGAAGGGNGKEPATTGVSATPPSSGAPASLLLELAAVCVEQRLGELARECLAALPPRPGQGQGWGREGVLREVLECALLTQGWAGAEESYTRSSVEVLSLIHI